MKSSGRLHIVSPRHKELQVIRFLMSICNSIIRKKKKKKKKKEEEEEEQRLDQRGGNEVRMRGERGFIC